MVRHKKQFKMHTLFPAFFHLNEPNITKEMPVGDILATADYLAAGQREDREFNKEELVKAAEKSSAQNVLVISLLNQKKEE